MLTITNQSPLRTISPDTCCVALRMASPHPTPLHPTPPRPTPPNPPTQPLTHPLTHVSTSDLPLPTPLPLANLPAYQHTDLPTYKFMNLPTYQPYTHPYTPTNFVRWKQWVILDALHGDYK